MLDLLCSCFQLQALKVSDPAVSDYFNFGKICQESPIPQSLFERIKEVRMSKDEEWCIR